MKVSDSFLLYHDEEHCMSSSSGEKGCIFDMQKIEVMLVAAPITPHALLLDECEDVLEFQEQLGKLGLETSNRHAHIPYERARVHVVFND